MNHQYEQEELEYSYRKIENKNELHLSHLHIIRFRATREVLKGHS